MKKISLYILVSLLLIPAFCSATTTPTTAAPVTVSGNDKYTLLEPLPCIEGVGGCTAGKDQADISLNDYIGYIYKFLIAIAAFLAIFMIIWGGFEYMLSDSITNKSDAKSKFENAAKGLLMVLASYLILRTIDPRLVEINTRIPAIVIKTEETSNFLAALNKDYTRLSQQSKEEVAALNAQNDSLQKSKDDLAALYKNGSISKDEYDLKNSQFTANINSNNSDIAQKTFVEASYSKYVDLTSILRNTKPSDFNVVTGQGVVADYLANWAVSPSINVIDDLATKNIQDINASFDAQKEAAGNDTQTILNLSVAQTFYTDSIKDEVVVVKAVNAYNDCTLSCTDKKNYLTGLLADYQKDLDTTTSTQVVDGVRYNTNQQLNNQYKIILQTRISYLQSVLNPPPK